MLTFPPTKRWRNVWKQDLRRFIQDTVKSLLVSVDSRSFSTVDVVLWYWARLRCISFDYLIIYYYHHYIIIWFIHQLFFLSIWFCRTSSAHQQVHQKERKDGERFGAFAAVCSCPVFPLAVNGKTPTHPPPSPLFLFLPEKKASACHPVLMFITNLSAILFVCLSMIVGKLAELWTSFSWSSVGQRQALILRTRQTRLISVRN